MLRRNGQWLKRVIAGFDPQTHTISHATRCVPTGLTGWDAGSSPAGHRKTTFCSMTTTTIPQGYLLSFARGPLQFLQITVAFWREPSLLRRNGQWLKRVIAGFDPQTHTISHATRCVPTGLTGWDAGASPAGHQKTFCTMTTTTIAQEYRLNGHRRATAYRSLS